MKCYGCGVDKDNSIKEVYPYPKDERLTTDPIPPLCVLECQPDDAFVNKHNCQTWRAVVVCHECFRKLDPDMWISVKCWESLTPRIEFKDLPAILEHDPTRKIWQPESYPEL